MQQLKFIKGLIKNTPMVEIKYEFQNKINYIYAKCEWFSLTGSIKDKPAFQIFYDAYKSGKLHTGDKIVEVSSGNMGISICAIANLLGNPSTIIMPKNMSKERKLIIKQYGATLVEVENFKEAFALENEYIKNGYFCTNQFANKSNTKANRQITAKEIYQKIKNKNIEYFISGIGTSGTLSGIGEFLKQKLNLKVLEIQPKNSRILSNQKPFLPHKIQGISDEIIPALYDKALVDKIISISDEDAIAMSQKLCKELSLGVGISSGANFIGAVLSQKPSVIVFPDDNKKYLSTDLANPCSTPLVEKIHLLSVRKI